MAFRTRRTRKTPVSKTAFRSKITKKQAQFKRFKKRYNNTNSASMKRFCRTEAARIVKQLNKFKKQWKQYGFGASAWINNNYNMSNFVRTTSRKNTSRRSHRRSHTSRSHGRRSNAWKSSRKTSYARKSRRSYTAW